MRAVFLVAAIAGLCLPGYLLARLLGLRRCWIVAFPFSALLLVEMVILLTLAGWSLSFANLSLFLIGMAIIFWLAIKRLGSIPMPVAEKEPSAGIDRLEIFCFVVAAVIVTLVAFRAALFPLSGFDTYFRWEGLARLMLQQQTLDFYPPLSAADFSVYVFPDGMPPLVASVYWWLYAAWGQPTPAVTTISVTLQLTSALALIYHATRLRFGRGAAPLALLAAATSNLFVSSFAIGQETGFTALSVAGQFYCVSLAVRDPRARLVVAAALFAALGAMSREYGPALALTGFVGLAWYPQTRRHLPLFIGVVAVTAAPWYLRSWLLAGNPLYPHAIPGGFAHNPVYAEMLRFYQEFRAVAGFSGGEWLKVLAVLGSGSALVVFVGVPFAMRFWRDTTQLLIPAILVVFLWLYSIGQTAGGVTYSMRVLSPVVVVFAMCAGAGLTRLCQWRRTVFRVALYTGLVACGLYAAFSAAAHPFPAKSIAPAFLSRGSDPPEFCAVQPELVNRLQSRGQPVTGVLTDDMYLATMLQRHTHFRPVVIWSPEVRFVFDPQFTAEEVRRRLLELNVRLVVIENDSPNTLMLMRHPFYQDYRRWSLLFAVADRAAIFSLE